MTVAAARKGWLPGVLAVIGRVGSNAADNPAEEETRDGSDAPINALVLSAILSSLYILFGNFRALLTFNGLGEYTFFFLTVVGAIILRFREPALRRPYKPHIAVPSAFAAVSGFVVVRGAVFAPVQAAVLVAVWLVGLLFYSSRGRW